MLNTTKSLDKEALIITFLKAIIPIKVTNAEIIDNNSSRIKKEFSSKIDLRYTPKLKFELINNK